MVLKRTSKLKKENRKTKRGRILTKNERVIDF